jgi:hypothetical protein
MTTPSISLELEDAATSGGRRGRRLRSVVESEFAGAIAAVSLPPAQRTFLESRWLGQVVWMESAAARSRVPHYALRLTTVVGAVVIPALVGLELSGAFDVAIGWTTFALSLLVASSAAVEEFFRFGERWRHYRRTAERLKREGWLFLQLSGTYRRFGGDRSTAYPVFADRVEAILQQEVEGYFEDVVARKEPDEKKEAE